MVDELYPLQFIEGMNENGEVNKRKQELIQIHQCPNVALGFSPNRTFLLNNIEIYLFWHEFVEPVEYEVTLYPDYNDNPAYIALREGKLSFDKASIGFGWRNISLKQPVVVFAKDNYWIALKSLGANFLLAEAKEGKRVAFSNGEPGDWFNNNSINYQLMLRFYGRVLPVVS